MVSIGQRRGRRSVGWLAAGLAALIMLPVAAEAQRAFDPERLGAMWPNTDFTKHSVAFEEVFSGGVPRDGIPPIDDPISTSIEAVGEFLQPTEPVVTVVVNGEARAYPLGVLTRHEIVNDELGGQPISVTFCPLCNSAVVFDRRVGDQILDFGVSGLLRNSDLIMWDRQTESWWQQFTGEGIVGEMTGTQLTMLPVRVESWAKYKERHPDGTVNSGSEMFGGLNNAYLMNPYVGYDQSGKPADQQDRPFLFFGELPTDAAPLTYVVSVGNEAWTIEALKAAQRVEHNDLVLTWEPGQNAVMDTGVIRQGHDLGNVTVQRDVDGELVDTVHDVTFAFAFNAFRPEGIIYTEAKAASGSAIGDLSSNSTLLMILLAVVVLVVGGLMVMRMRRKSAAS